MLFNPFIQVDSSTTREFGGTGLGLSIARRLCELMDGDVSVKSQQDVGSIFSFTLEQLPASKDPEAWRRHITPERVTLLGHIGGFERMLGELLFSWGATVSSIGREEEVPESDIIIYSIPDNMDLLAEHLSHWLQFSQQGLKVIPLLSYRQQIEFEKQFPKQAYLGRPLNIRQLIACLADGDQALEETHTSHSGKTLIEAKVLLVEDNKVNQMVALGMLKQLGVDADVAANGKEALRVLREHTDNPYQLILMDCLMPELDGFQTTEAIRAGEGGCQFSGIPIIALTANAMKGDREQCIRAGMDDYLTKPLVVEVLRECLLRWCRHTQIIVDEFSALPEDTVSVADDSVPLFDRNSALELIGGDEALLQEILQVFIEEMTQHRAQFIAAIEAKDCALARASVHAIKGAASNLSMTPLVEMARQLESAARHGELQTLVAQKRALLDILDATLACC